MPLPTIIWNVDADGDWAASTDWNLGRLPNSTDNVSINTTDLHAITHSTGHDTVHTLTVGNDDFVVSGGSLKINSTSSFANLLTVSGGTLALGGAATVANFSQGGALGDRSTVSGAGTLTVTGGATFTSDTLLQTGSGTTVLQGASTFNDVLFFGLDGGRVLENQGTCALTGNGQLLLGYNPFGAYLHGATLKNDAGATIDIQGVWTVAYPFNVFDPLGSFTNAGTLKKTVDTGVSLIRTTFTDTGTIRIDSGTLQFQDSDASFAGAISGAGSLSFAAGTQELNSGTTLTVAQWSISSGDAVTVNENLTYAGTFSQNAGTTLTISAADKLRLTGRATFAGSVTGAGTLTFAGGTQALNGASLTVSNWVISNAAATSLNQNLTYGGAFIEAAATTLTVAAGDTLSLTGGATLAGTVDGAGTLGFAGGTQVLNSGANLTIARWSISGGAATSVNEILSYAGVFSQSAGTTVTIAAGDKLRLSGSSSLAGTVAGAGTLTFAGGTQALNGANLTVANWVISGDAATTLNVGLTYAGAFIQAAATTLAVSAGDTLSLAGAATLAGTVNGAGTVQLSNATLNGLTVGGTATLSDVGSVDQIATVTIGDATSNAATLLIGSGATYRIDNDSGIARGTSFANNLENSGLLIKSGGTGVSVIGVKTTDTGAIEAASGSLKFTKAITGSGTLAVDSGATLEVNLFAAASLDMTFNGGAATLALGSPSQFAATIHGFAATDTIDLLATQANRATLRSGDRLVIFSGGAAIATLQLAGDYSGATFNVASDGNGGTNITVTNGPVIGVPGGPPLPADHPAVSSPGPRFIAAMAGFGGDSHGPVSVFSEAHYTHPPMLAGPRMAMA